MNAMTAGMRQQEPGAPAPRVAPGAPQQPGRTRAPDQRPRTRGPQRSRARGHVWPAKQRARRRPGKRRVRLTRRGRVVVTVLLMAVMMLLAGLAWIAGAARADAAGSGPPPSAVYRNLTPVIVQPGESLWTIAVHAEPAADPRSVIQEIIDLNALGGTSIQPGERIWVPR